MEIERAYQYAHCTVVLGADHEVPGCEAIFDQALSNGLLAIVAAQWPGEERDPKGSWMRSAKQLLTVIEEKTDAQPDGTRLIPWTDHGDSEGIRVDTDTLREGVTKTQAPRHGRGPGTLERSHVDALLTLDRHPALRRITEVASDGLWIKAEVRDRYDRDRAQAYLEFLGGDEAQARAERAPELVEYPHPKHNPDREGSELECCAVCEYESFKLDYPTEIPDTGSGACLVCSYARSSDTAYYLSLNAELRRAIDTD
ncbi:hypothetical protein [Streptomyces sp. SM11]|uniref:hypothetical protein n=1 Tax=Streptomyces sp. SM11 TaxID=565557 RepID=UPI000CD512C3|nr:hypothetical protein [Streptomyces sp. SM11]